MITMDPVKILPGETEKEVRLKISEKALQKLKRFRFGIAIVGVVNGEVEKKGKRSFQNAKYREMAPLFVLGKE